MIEIVFVCPEPSYLSLHPLEDVHPVFKYLETEEPYTNNYIKHILENYDSYETCEEDVILFCHDTLPSNNIIENLPVLSADEGNISVDYFENNDIKDLFRNANSVSAKPDLPYFKVTKKMILSRSTSFYRGCLNRNIGTLFHLIYDPKYKSMFRIKEIEDSTSFHFIEDCKICILYPEGSKYFYKMAVAFQDLCIMTRIKCDIKTNTEYRKEKKKKEYICLFVLGFSSKLLNRNVYIRHDITTEPHILILDDTYVEDPSIVYFQGALLQKWKMCDALSDFYLPFRMPMYSLISTKMEQGGADVVFIGSMSGRRKALYNHLDEVLTSHGFTIEFMTSGCFKEDTKIVLNIHKDVKCEHIEMGRIEGAALKGKCVISEPSQNMELDKIYKNSCIYTNYSDIPSSTVVLLQNPERLLMMREKAYRDAFLRQSNVKYFKECLTRTLNFV